MTPNPTSISPGQTTVDALRLMRDGGFRDLSLLKGTGSWGSFPAANSTASGSVTTNWECS